MEYVYAVVILIGLYIVLAASFNLIIGYGGLISIAHPIFYAIGAYASAILSRDYGFPIPLAMLAGTLIALVASIMVALPSLRVSGDYLLIASIGFQLGLIEVFKNASWTGGAGGFTNIPAALSASVPREVYVAIVVVVAALAALLVRAIAHGPYGRAMAAMRDDEVAFSALGRNAVAMKVGTFALGSALAGFAGALYAHYFRFVAPEQFDILQSSVVLTMVVVGGIRSTWGPVVGAVLLQALPQAITFLNLPPAVLGPLQGLLFTGLVLVFMFVRPQGLVSAGEVWSATRKGSEHARS
ncbi:ABC transporter permease [Afipia sp. P52-10]|uniref:branched-chain amino acid ABC transporter permease n=1 Tax=Afipia sp. P52-10 TaxID=1429916 RepID=UPI0003DF35E5|nr:branched-chain amino acid ABC transporter permease [Afipia sp. P52-10]ETR78725.1 ABC transporter permease [Afipia sp. P52-10]